MYRTIQVSSCVLIQGEFVEALADGRVVVRDGRTTYRGRPVGHNGAPVMSAGAMNASFESTAPIA